jgi:hypothetical protein
MNKFAAVLILVAIMFCSCETPPPTEESLSMTKEDYQNLLRDKKTLIESLYAAINSAMLMADTAPITDSFFISESSLGFNAVIGTHTNNADPDSSFNAVFVSSYNAGLPLPEGMTTDWFESSVYSDLISCKNGGTAKSYGLFENDERLWSTSYAFVQSLTQLRYVVVVHPVQFNAGALYTSRETFDPSSMQGVLMIYDIKEKRICGAKKIQVEGPQNISYSYDAPSSQNGWKDKSDDAAKNKFETENRDTLVGNTFRVLESQFVIKR